MKYVTNISQKRSFFCQKHIKIYWQTNTYQTGFKIINAALLLKMALEMFWKRKSKPSVFAEFVKMVTSFVIFFFQNKIFTQARHFVLSAPGATHASYTPPHSIWAALIRLSCKFISRNWFQFISFTSNDSQLAKF